MKKQIVLLFIVLSFFLSTDQVNSQTGDPFIGEIRMFAGNFAPRGWALCNGQLLSINENQALFSILGTTYGGDGRTTFGLPDLRSRFAMHAGNGPGLTNRPLGQKSGFETHILNISQLPSHNHTVTIGAAEEGTNEDPNGNHIGGFGVNAFSPTSDVNLAVPTVGNTGNNQSVNHMPPYTTVNYIIALIGTFPSRN